MKLDPDMFFLFRRVSAPTLEETVRCLRMGYLLPKEAEPLRDLSTKVIEELGGRLSSNS